MISELAKIDEIETRKVFDSELRMIRAWLFKIRESKEDHEIVLNKCGRDPKAKANLLKLAAKYGKAKHRAKELQMLEERPEIQRAYVTDTESDPDNVILTMVVRGMASFEMLIPRHKYDPFLVLEITERGSAIQ